MQQPELHPTSFFRLFKIQTPKCTILAAADGGEKARSWMVRFCANAIGLIEDEIDKSIKNPIPSFTCVS